MGKYAEQDPITRDEVDRLLSLVDVYATAATNDANSSGRVGWKGHWRMLVGAYSKTFNLDKDEAEQHLQTMFE